MLGAPGGYYFMGESCLPGAATWAGWSRDTHLWVGMVGGGQPGRGTPQMPPTAALAALDGCQRVPCQRWHPPRCPPGLLYSVEVDAILTRFHGKSLLWPERPGRPTEEPVSTDYEDGYRGEQ